MGEIKTRITITFEPDRYVRTCNIYVAFNTNLCWTDVIMSLDILQMKVDNSYSCYCLT